MSNRARRRASSSQIPLHTALQPCVHVQTVLFRTSKPRYRHNALTSPHINQNDIALPFLIPRNSKPTSETSKTIKYIKTRLFSKRRLSYTIHTQKTKASKRDSSFQYIHLFIIVFIVLFLFGETVYDVTLREVSLSPFYFYLSLFYAHFRCFVCIFIHHV